MTNKPREFWIYPFKPAKMLFTYTEPNELKQSAPENFDEIHVIEYSAYQALLEQAEKKDKIIQELVKALEFYANGGNFSTDVWEHPEFGYFTGKTARATLESVRSKI